MNDIKNCIVGVLVDGELQGTGYVVSEKLVITCAHVLTDGSEPPTGGVSIRFHSSGDESPVDVSTQWWSESDQNDIAALKLGKPLPPGVEIARLAKSAGRKNRVCEVFGYPDVGNLKGLGGRATVIEYVDEVDGRKLVQLESRSATCGYSGSPLFDPETGEVIGTVVEIAEQALARYAEHLHARLEELAFATPLEVIAELIPDLPFDSDQDLDDHKKAVTRVCAGIQKILSNQQGATAYLARQINGLEQVKEPSQQITEHLLAASLADFLPLVIGGFMVHAKTEPNVAEAFRDLATFIFPQIYNQDLLREIRRRLKSGNFLVIPASHKAIIELVLTGVHGLKLNFNGAWQFHEGIPSGNLEISPSAERGILNGVTLHEFRQDFEHAIMQKIGGLPQKMPEPTKAINRKLAKLKSGEPPIQYYFVYPNGQSRVEELEHQYPNVVFIFHELTGHDDNEFDILDGLKDMFCPESDQ